MLNRGALFLSGTGAANCTALETRLAIPCGNCGPLMGDRAAVNVLVNLHANENMVDGGGFEPP